MSIELDHTHTAEQANSPVPEMPTGDWVRLRVTDSGSGIQAETLSHIFEPFFTTKEVGKGSGLGLAQVYGIVQRHEGFVDVSTELGRGTTFSLYLPRFVTESTGAYAAERSPYKQGQGQTLLVVEDDPATRAALVESLMLLNYEIIEAANGREALSVLKSRAAEIALVLSDVVMPEMGGIALYHAIQQQHLNIPIVLLTGHPLNHELEILETLELAGWQLKPPDLVKLSQLLARLLEN